MCINLLQIPHDRKKSAIMVLDHPNDEWNFTHVCYNESSQRG